MTKEFVTACLKRAFSVTTNFIWQELLGGLYAYRTGYLLEKKAQQMKDRFWHPDFKLVLTRALNVDSFICELIEYQVKQDDRRKTIDEKAKSSLFIIALSTTLMLGGVNLMNDGKLAFRSPLVVIMVVGLAYFVLAGITAVKALIVGGFYDFQLDDRVRPADKEVTVGGLEKERKARFLYFSLKLNEFIIERRTNLLHATLTGIRNGVVLLVAGFIVVVGNIGGQVEHKQINRENVENSGRNSTANGSNFEPVDASSVSSQPAAGSQEPQQAGSVGETNRTFDNASGPKMNEALPRGSGSVNRSDSRGGARHPRERAKNRQQAHQKEPRLKKS